jgi:hypothetical protein
MDWNGRGHEDSVAMSVFKVHISATRWRFIPKLILSLQKRRATAKSPNGLTSKCPTLASISSQD